MVEYNFVLGRDVLQEFGLDIINSRKKISWDGIKTKMSYKLKKLEAEELRIAEKPIILKAKYEKQNLKELANVQTPLPGVQREEFL